MTADRVLAPPPDAKDWTWVLDRPCAECGYAAADLDRTQTGALLRADAAAWVRDLADPRATLRPAPTVWSVLEYACHVRDVHRVFLDRLQRMLTEDDPLFANWDQDETALAERYHAQDPAVVAVEVIEAAGRVAEQYDALASADVAGEVPGEVPGSSGARRWQRPGRRSNGSAFTVDSLARYHLHDVVHHRWDVRWLRAGAAQ